MARVPHGAALGGLGALAGATAAVSLVTLGRVKDAAIDAALHGRPIEPGALLRGLGPLDVVLLGLAAAAAAWVLVLEIRGRAFTRLLEGMTAAEFWVVGAVLIAWMGHAYLASGLMLGGDIGTHVSRFLEVSRGLDQGRLVGWTNYQYIGAPLLWFTGPFSYVVGGGLTWALGGDAVLAAKVLLFGLHMAAGLMFLGVLRRLGFGPVPALLAGVGFAGSFAHLHLFLYRGVLPQAFTILFMVLVFWGADGLLRGRGARWLNALGFGLATGGLIVNHQPHALFVGAYLALFGVVALWAGFWRWRGVPVLAAAGVLGVVAGAVAVVPVLLEADGVMIEPEGGLFGLRVPTLARLWELVAWGRSLTGTGTDYWAYLGLGLIGFGAVGLVGLAGAQLGPGRRLLAGAALLCLGVELFLYNVVVRDVMFMLFFLALLAAAGIEWALGRGWLRGGWLLAVAGVVLLDLASTSVQPVLRNDKGFMLDAGRYLERTAAGSRFLQLTIMRDGRLDVDMGPQGTLLGFDALVQRVAGNHNMAAARVHNFLGAVGKRAQAELAAGGALSAEVRGLLGLLNVSRVVCASSTAMGCPPGFKDTADDPVLGRYVPVAASPALFSRGLVEQRLPAGVDKPMLWDFYYDWPAQAGFIRGIEAAVARFAATEQPDPAAAAAAVIPVQQPVAEAGESGALRGVVRGYDVTLDRVAMRVEAAGAGWVQLAHPWFPGTAVTVDGRPVAPLRGTIGLLVLPVAAGVSEIVLQAVTTGVERASLWASAAGVLGLVTMALLLLLRDRRGQPG